MKKTLIGDGLAQAATLDEAALQAAESALGRLRGQAPDLAFVFVSGGTPGEAASALRTAREHLGARTAIGCSAEGVMGRGRGVEGKPCVSVWAAVLPDVIVRSFHLEVMRDAETTAVMGTPSAKASDVIGVLLGDPWSFPAEGFLQGVPNVLHGLPLAGGMASGSTYRGDTRLLLNDHVYDRGAVGIVLGGAVSAQVVVSQGCRPVGQPMTVTSVDGLRIKGLASKSALDQAIDLVDSLGDEDRAMAIAGLQLGIALDEYSEEYDHGDFLVRSILGADRSDGSIALGQAVPVGSTVQFQLRDGAAAHSDLSQTLSTLRDGGRFEQCAGALLIASNGRGQGLFASADHDIEVVRLGLGTDSVAGFFADGEIGPAGGRNHLHGNSATVLAFG
ncbi:MAG: FIST N-terminal domain-containing protein [Actinomycetes bacterium]